MPIRAKLILDSGCFLPLEEDEQTYSRIGLFGCNKSTPDFTVRIDGKETNLLALTKLGDYPKIEVRHVGKDKTARKGRVTFPKSFHRRLLQLKDLYGEHVPVNPTAFDCIITFNTGRFSSKSGRPGRVFKNLVRAKGKQMLPTKVKPKALSKEIMHDLVVRYILEDGESIQLLINGKPFWSSSDADAKRSVEITINADESTVPKYFGDSFATVRTDYWLPNPSDPPPMCPNPPCQPPLE